LITFAAIIGAAQTLASNTGIATDEKKQTAYHAQRSAIAIEHVRMRKEMLVLSARFYS
jgi:hypothetical protein